MPTLLLHDCDPGIDDAAALLLALASPELRLLAVTTTHGNVALATTTRNALNLLAWAGHPGVPVYSGAERPLERDPVYAPEVHGTGGLGGVGLPHSDAQARPGAPEVMARLARQQAGQLSVCATGPLTNLALAARLDPGWLGQLRALHIMGGSVSQGSSLEAGHSRLGNVTEHAEFNAHADPHALAEVLAACETAGLRPHLYGLNLTRQVRVTRERVAALAQAGAAGALIAEMLSDYLDRVAGRQAHGALHDPCTVAGVLAPGLFRYRPARVRVVTDGEQAGMTVLEAGRPNVQLAEQADEDGVWTLMQSRLAGLTR